MTGVGKGGVFFWFGSGDFYPDSYCSVPEYFSLSMSILFGYIHR